MDTQWAAVKERIKGRSTENILKAAEFHIRGLESVLDIFYSPDVRWPRQKVLDIIAYAVLDTTKVRFEDHRKFLEDIAEGTQGIEFRGFEIPREQTKDVAKGMLVNYGQLMGQYDEIQETLECIREEQGGANCQLSAK